VVLLHHGYASTPRSAHSCRSSPCSSLARISRSDALPGDHGCGAQAGCNTSWDGLAVRSS
jgi:hypothetical protein